MRDTNAALTYEMLVCESHVCIDVVIDIELDVWRSIIRNVDERFFRHWVLIAKVNGWRDVEWFPFYETSPLMVVREHQASKCFVNIAYFTCYRGVGKL